MTSGGGRKRRWDLDDHGQVHAPDAEESLAGKKKTTEAPADAVELAREAAQRIAAKLKQTVGEEEPETPPAVEEKRASAGEEKPPISSSGETGKGGDSSRQQPSTRRSSEESAANTRPLHDTLPSIKVLLGMALEEPSRDERETSLEAAYPERSELDINDSRHRYHLIKPTIVRDIESTHQVVIKVVGKYYPDRSLVKENDPPPLKLIISAKDAAGLQAALAKLNDIRDNGPPPPPPPPAYVRSQQQTLPPPPPPPPMLTDKVFAPFRLDEVPSVGSVRAKILGPQGAYLKHIQSEAGVRAHLRGKGSGYVEIGQREDQLESLHILIIGEKQADIDRARPLCEDLLATVKAELDAAKAVPALTPYGAYGVPTPGLSAIQGASMMMGAGGIPYGGAGGGYGMMMMPPGAPPGAYYGYPPYGYPGYGMYHPAAAQAAAPAPPPPPSSLGGGPPPLSQDTSAADLPPDYSSVPPPPGLYRQ